MYVVFFIWQPIAREELLSWHLRCNNTPIYNSPREEIGRLPHLHWRCDSTQHGPRNIGTSEGQPIDVKSPNISNTLWCSEAILGHIWPQISHAHVSLTIDLRGPFACKCNETFGCLFLYLIQLLASKTRPVWVKKCESFNISFAPLKPLKHFVPPVVLSVGNYQPTGQKLTYSTLRFMCDAQVWRCPSSGWLNLKRNLSLHNILRCIHIRCVWSTLKTPLSFSDYFGFSFSLWYIWCEHTSCYLLENARKHLVWQFCSSHP